MKMGEFENVNIEMLNIEAQTKKMRKKETLKRHFHCFISIVGEDV